ncbi:unnamed protein product [Symbiodinium necroappetens]|uniref:Uncharacterized protein n=1 Tax=Symbiodinium necroappetens TaxID=1628268 RepID=A0A813CB62_9DINO|nr:unnamed protein product [Symbiodinium necroappetens]
MDLVRFFTKFQCWSCECGDLGELAEQKAPVSVAPLDFRFQRFPGDRERRASESSQGLASEPASEIQNPQQSPREKQRHELKQLMRRFATRGMDGVSIQLFDELSGSTCPGVYQIDDLLEYIRLTPEDTADSAPYAGPEHIAYIREVVSVSSGAECAAHVEPGAWQQLTSDEHARLLVLVYHTQPHGSLPPVDCRKVCFLEDDESACQMFAICVRILRRYMEDARQSQHNRLEEALAVLQEGQKMYATQQKVMDSQQETIERLCRSKPNGLEKPAPEAVPAKSGRDEARARAEAKAQVMRPSAQKQESPSPQSPEEDNEFLGMDTQQAEQVLAALQAMLAEKEQLHQQLLNEQADAERRLQALREMGSA